MLRPTASCQTRAAIVPVRVSTDDRDGHAVAQGRTHRQRSVIDVDVVLLLPAVAIEPLPEVALVVVETDADERDAEIRRALDVIASEDAEAAGVDRQRLVDAELGREVGNRACPEHAGVASAPRVRGVQVLLEAPVGVVDAAVQRELRRPLLEFVDRDLLQQRHRIVVERRATAPDRARGRGSSYPDPSSTTNCWRGRRAAGARGRRTARACAPR